jgi:integrase
MAVWISVHLSGWIANPPATGFRRGYALANADHDTRAIQGWLGHRSITSTAVYPGPGADPVQGFLARLSGTRAAA